MLLEDSKGGRLKRQTIKLRLCLLFRLTLTSLSLRELINQSFSFLIARQVAMTLLPALKYMELHNGLTTFVVVVAEKLLPLDLLLPHHLLLHVVVVL